jgi:hypothetical protein
MNVQQLLDQILPLLSSIRGDKDKLAKLLDFMEEEFLPDEEQEDDDDEEQEDDDDKTKLPEKYKDIVKQIADNLGANFISFFNPDTLELEYIPKGMLDEDFFDEEDEENMFGITHKKWDKCIEIEPLDSHESFEIMADFVNQLKNGKEANKLAQALNGHKPFANFNHLIHNSNFREDWFAFRQKKLEKYVIRHYFYEYLQE